jgi:hypothetical protein
VKVKKPYHGARRTSSAIRMARTMKKITIRRGRCRQSGCRVKFHSIHSPAAAARPRSISRSLVDSPHLMATVIEATTTSNT